MLAIEFLTVIDLIELILIKLSDFMFATEFWLLSIVFVALLPL